MASNLYAGLLVLALPFYSPVVPQRTAPARDTARVAAMRSHEATALRLHSDSLARRAANADSLYIAMLEKANTQLGLTSNPYGLFVAAIGVLFAIGAIVVAFVLFHQSSEYRKSINEAIAKYQVVLEALVREKLQELDKAAKEKLAGLEQDAKTATADRKASLDSEIEAARKEVEAFKKVRFPSGSLGANLGFSVPSGTTIFAGSLGAKKTHCTSCGQQFAIPVDPMGFFHYGQREVFCSACGAKNSI